MPKITAIIVSFMRPQYTIDCIRTLHEYFPDVRILVGENYERDESIEKATKDARGQYIVYPYDSGNSFVRNRLIEKVRTKYVWVGDDDFWYDENAKIYEMRAFLENTDFDIIGCPAVSRNTNINKNGGNHYFIKEYGDHIHFIDAPVENTKVEPKSGLSYIVCDSVAQCFLAKTKSMIKWDERIFAVHEHPKFFIDAKRAGKKIAYTIDSFVWHKKQGNLNSEKYKSYRWRGSDLKTFLDIEGIDYYKILNKSYGRNQAVGRIKAYYAIRATKVNGKVYNKGDRVYFTEKFKKLHPDLVERSLPARIKE